MKDQKVRVSVISLKHEAPQVQSKSADFEDAISAAGFGKFNIYLIAVSIPAIFTALFEGSILSFVLPAAQCDLKLSLEDKGLLNAVTYAGMLASCLICGSLADIFGRRKVLMAVAFLDSIFILMAGLSSNTLTLLFAKFFSGAIMNGTSTALTPYLSEFHSKHHRSRIPLLIGLLYNVANVFLPLLAWVILPLDVKIIFGALELHAWNLFILMNLVFTFIAGILFILMPETPKFMMTKGDNIQAMSIFQTIYKINTGNPKESYPVIKLIDEKENYTKKKNPFKEAWRQISPVFSLKYAKNLTLVCLLQGLLMLSANTIRFWLPQMFQAANDFANLETNKTATFCNIINSIQVLADENPETCVANMDNSSVYTNSVIVAFVSIAGYLVSTSLINIFGKKKMLGLLGLTGSICCSSLYFAETFTVALILMCTFIMCVNISVDVVLAIAIDLFPTTLRASAFSLCLMCGRVGVVLGNLLFPMLLRSGCAPPFFTLGFITLCCAMIPLLLPNTEMKPLE